MAAYPQNPLLKMSPEELWSLFPIELVPHRSVWRDWYKQVEQQLQHILPADGLAAIHHIGSTAIDGIWAKNIVDVLVEFNRNVPLRSMADILSNDGFLTMSQTGNRASLNKGYTPEGWVEPIYHVHLRYRGDNDELYFRDYLNAHPAVAKDYERLKLELAPRYRHDRDGYTEAKSGFISTYTLLGKKAYPHRYSQTDQTPRRNHTKHNHGVHQVEDTHAADPMSGNPNPNANEFIHVPRFTIYGLNHNAVLI